MANTKKRRDLSSLDFDTVVIGSGAGGLTAALLLARAGQKVLVLEQHYLPGGWCHSFNLGGFTFSPGVHYIGELGPGGTMRELYEKLGVADHLTFYELNRDGYDHVQAGKQRFDIPKTRAAYEDRLAETFPKYAQGIRSYLDVVEQVGQELKAPLPKGLKGLARLPKTMPTLLAQGFRSADGVLDQHGLDDPFLRTVLTAQAGDHGVGPKRAPFAMHAAITDHYFDGGWYPKGGARSLPKAFIKELRKHGGEIMVNASVAKILVDGTGTGRRASGVVLADGTHINARQVVSNADPGVTFGRLLDPGQLSTKLKLRLKATKFSLSALSLFFAVDADVRELGLDSGNLWFNDEADVQASYDAALDPRRSLRQLPGFFLTATTLKDPTKRKDGLHTLEMFSLTTAKPFERWAKTTYGERPAAYETLKKTLTEQMLAKVDSVVPGLRDKAVFVELGTPLTNRHYVEATEGNLYGIEKSRFQVGPFSYPVRTEIPGLFMCGASTIAHGVAGATMSGVAAAGAILRCRRTEMLNASSTLTTLEAEKVAAGKVPSAKAKAESEEELQAA